MINTNIIAGLEMNLKHLKLSTMLKKYKEIMTLSLDSNLGFEEMLLKLTEQELEERYSTKIKMLLKQAKFPIDKPLSSFDFNELKSLKKETIVQLCIGDFIENYSNILFIGNPGCGKTHLAISIGRELCLKGKRVLFTSCCELSQELLKASSSLTLFKYFKKLNRYHLIILDELGYTPLRKEEAELLFQFISNFYEKGSLLITTNLVFSQWEKIFLEPIRTKAAVDRIIHHSIIFNLEEEASYRTKIACKQLNKRK